MRQRNGTYEKAVYPESAVTYHCIRRGSRHPIKANTTERNNLSMPEFISKSPCTHSNPLLSTT